MRRLFIACIVTALAAVGCAEPPHKEMDQAQGSIDAARAAGAERYAPDEYAAATTALNNSNDAVTAGDYRLALNYALESLEQSLAAAKTAADNKARVRAEVERNMTEIAGLLAQANTQLAAARRARVPARLLSEPTRDLDASNANVQKAGEAIKADDYIAAREALEGVRERMEGAVADIDAALASRARR